MRLFFRESDVKQPRRQLNMLVQFRTNHILGLNHLHPLDRAAPRARLSDSARRDGRSLQEGRSARGGLGQVECGLHGGAAGRLTRGFFSFSFSSVLKIVAYWHFLPCFASESALIL